MTESQMFNRKQLHQVDVSTEGYEQGTKNTSYMHMALGTKNREIPLPWAHTFNYIPSHTIL